MTLKPRCRAVLSDPDQAARGPAGLLAGRNAPAMQHADRRLLPQDNLKHTYLTDSSEALLGSVDLRGGYLHQYLERLSLQRLKQATLFPPVSEQRPVSINFLPVRPRPCRAFERPADLQIPLGLFPATGLPLPCVPARAILPALSPPLPRRRVRKRLGGPAPGSEQAARAWAARRCSRACRRPTQACRRFQSPPEPPERAASERGRRAESLA